MFNGAIQTINIGLCFVHVNECKVMDNGLMAECSCSFRQVVYLSERHLDILKSPTECSHGFTEVLEAIFPTSFYLMTE